MTYRFKPTDELRAVLDSIPIVADGSDSYHVCLAHVLYALDAWAEKHPGLVDLTICGPQCPAYRTELDPDCARGRMCARTKTGQPCPLVGARRR